jgi:hypothetical protein
MAGYRAPSELGHGLLRASGTHRDRGERERTMSQFILLLTGDGKVTRSLLNGGVQRRQLEFIGAAKEASRR